MARNKVLHCELCNGTGWIPVEDSLDARPCRCQRDVKKQRRIAAAQIPKRYYHCTLATFYPRGNASLDSAKRVANEYVSTWPHHDRSGLLLMGPCGVGKTHLAVSVLQEIIAADKPGKLLFSNFQDLIQQIQASFSDDSAPTKSQILEPLVEADLLVLDELGSQKPTSFVQETLYHIINTRYNAERPTIFTTNYFDDRREESGETLEQRIGVGLRSRLYEMAERIQISGEDFRKKVVVAGRKI